MGTKINFVKFCLFIYITLVILILILDGPSKMAFFIILSEPDESQG